MGRYYHLSKEVSEMQSKEIVKEIKALSDVRNAKITEDHAYLIVETKDDQFENVMTDAVNICSKVGDNLELSFSKFAY